MVGQKKDDGEAEPPLRPPVRTAPAGERDKDRQGRRPEPKSRDIDLERVLYDPEYRQAVQQTLSPDQPPGQLPRDAKPQKR